jgi:preprotein translocase subunit SecE
VARQTRAQRRARRAEGTQDGVSQRGRPVATAAPRPAPVRQEVAERRAPGGGARQFVSEAWAELKKVEWPNQSQLIQGVVVVLVACVVVGIYLWGADQVFKPLVQKIFLR